jgi:hypothetical protein
MRAWFAAELHLTAARGWRPQAPVGTARLVFVSKRGPYDSQDPKRTGSAVA